MPIKFNDSQINFIDVGCNKGYIRDQFGQINPYKVFSIGIDPIDYGIAFKYNKYYEVAIDNITCGTEEIRTFNEYVEPGCNSLLDMNTDIIVHTRDKEGWYVGWEIERLTAQRDVKVRPLSDIIDETPELTGKPIHFIKIDTQGNDINVVRSLNGYIEKVLFIQMECVSSHKEDVVLYHGQQILEKDIEDMKEFGFEPVRITDHASQASPEADVIFKNTRYN